MMKWIIKYKEIDIKELNNSYLWLTKNLTSNIKEYKFDEYINKNNYDNFLMIKSWRSNIIEGNTTKKKILSTLLKNNNRNFNEIKSKPIGPTIDEELEITNLNKIYKEKFSYKISESQRINYILGENISHNNFNEFRGKLKIEENYILHKNDSDFTIYEINFSLPKIVKSELKKLFYFVNTHMKNKLSFKESIILATIFNIEFNRIHPFNDGNGRTSRYFFEKIFEDSNFLTLVFSTKKSKKKYKESLLKCDVNFYLTNKRYDYKNLVTNMLEMYENEIIELLKLISEI